MGHIFFTVKCYIQPIEPEFLLLTVMYMKLQFRVTTHPRSVLNEPRKMDN